MIGPEDNGTGRYRYLGEAFRDAVRAHRPFYPRILDVGCGHGIATGPMRTLCAEMTLVDPSPYAFAEQGQRWSGDANVSVLSGDIRCVDGRFDLVYYFLSLHHIPDAGAELAQVQERLASDGELALCEVIPAHTVPFHGKEEVPYDGFMPNELARILQESGFRVTQQQTIGTIIKEKLKYDLFVVFARLDKSEEEEESIPG